MPERWLLNPPAEFANDNREAHAPFSLGPRNCIGRNLAYSEMRLIMAKMVWSFDLKKANTPHSTIAWEKQDVFGIVIKHRLDVTFAERTA